MYLWIYKNVVKVLQKHDEKNAKFMIWGPLGEDDREWGWKYSEGFNFIYCVLFLKLLWGKYDRMSYMYVCVIKCFFPLFIDKINIKEKFLTLQPTLIIWHFSSSNTRRQQSVIVEHVVWGQTAWVWLQILIPPLGYLERVISSSCASVSSFVNYYKNYLYYQNFYLIVMFYKS